ncbi:hypothetical protein L6164_004925 [Bauhinia variegata]|uniref:Uncharacterized protein n=1 Tax=Bauhinia variegata TaxID=167791 RepID=A0ACB9PPE6_BAUVA|nr:hypothetical protein L6164_004925 [Bauhinia variegata]
MIIYIRMTLISSRKVRQKRRLYRTSCSHLVFSMGNGHMRIERLHFSSLEIRRNLMGHCPCFGPRKKDKTEKVKVEEEKANETKHEPPEDVPEPQISSGVVSELPPTTEINTPNKASIFNFRELATATKNFRDECFIGQGGFGAVYKGKLESTGQIVAVKQLDTAGAQGEKEFLMEVLMLSLLHHPNLVNMIGYCSEGDQRLLVYEYMPLGSLESHLHDLPPDAEPLQWKARMNIAYGTALGLNYLHNEANPPVIYRDLKSANILLDEGFHPKLSDFGLAKFGPTGDQSHVFSRVMGTHGYCAPEYASSGKLTTKSDIYSFGVLLLELVTGRKALDDSHGHDKFLVEWASSVFRERGGFAKLADPWLQGNYSKHGLRVAVELAFMCLREDANFRPPAGDIVLALGYLTSRSNTPKESSMVIDTESIAANETSRMLVTSLQREKAVAEAKQWGEIWREKRRQTAQSSSDGLNR